MSALTYQDVIRILDLIDRSATVDMELTSGDLHIKVTRAKSSVAADLAAAPTKAAPEAVPDAVPVAAPAGGMARQEDFPESARVTAPMGGMFYAAPAPGAPPFVEVGQEVRKGDQLGIVEVMKLFTPITAEADGAVVAILVKNQQTVAKDDVLMLIETRG